MIRFMLLAVLAIAAGCASVGTGDAFDFGVIGDMPYTKVQEREYQRVLAALNAADLAFVAHVGDFQFDARPYNQNPAIASMPCVEENYRAIYDSFQSVRHPFILTPGDNDWTDCWPLAAKKVDPLALLAGLRTRFFPRGAQSRATHHRGQEPVLRSAVRQVPRKPALVDRRRDVRQRAYRRQQRQFWPHAGNGRGTQGTKGRQHCLDQAGVCRSRNGPQPRPAVTLPVEIYSEARVREFDEAEAELAKVLRRRKTTRC